VRPAGLEVQERGVEAAEPVAVGHVAIQHGGGRSDNVRDKLQQVV
jgi:hypothetical protein